MRWTKKEDEILLNNYKKITYKKISELLPNRTERAIAQRIGYLRLNLKKVKWTPEEDEILLKNFLLSRKELQKLLPNKTIMAITIRCFYKKLKTKESSNAKIRTLKEDFWFPYNPVNCYWGGFCLADGCVQDIPRSKSISNIFSLMLSEKDLNWLTEFKNSVEYDGNFTKKTSIAPNSIRPTTCYGIQITCGKKWRDEMETYHGIKPNKTYRVHSPVMSDLLFKLCAIVGYLDGDGSIGLRIFYDTGKLSPYIKVQSCSKEIIYWIKETLENTFPYKKLPRKIHEVKTDFGKDFYIYHVTGLSAAIMIYYLNKLPCPHLPRKWGNLELIKKIEELKSQNSDKFYLISEELRSKIGD